MNLLMIYLLPLRTTSPSICSPSALLQDFKLTFTVLSVFLAFGYGSFSIWVLPYERKLYTFMHVFMHAYYPLALYPRTEWFPVVSRVQDSLGISFFLFFFFPEHPGAIPQRNIRLPMQILCNLFCLYHSLLVPQCCCIFSDHRVNDGTYRFSHAKNGENSAFPLWRRKHWCKRSQCLSWIALQYWSLNKNYCTRQSLNHCFQ